MLNPDSAQRKTIATELTEIKKLVNSHETRLKDLRKNNRRSFMFCAILVFLIFLLYTAYVLLYGYED